jgi:hypothetical protein
MYGQKSHVGILASGIGIASWWMLGFTITLCAVAILLLVRTIFTLRSTDRP